MNFVTWGDTEYFEPINHQNKNIHEYHPDATHYIYDEGFSEEERRRLRKRDNTTVIQYKDIFATNVKKRNTLQHRATNALLSTRYAHFLLKNILGWEYSRKPHDKQHYFMEKPYVISDCAGRINTNLIFLDADAIPVSKIVCFEDDFDIGVTLRPHEERVAARKRGDYHVLNAGVIFFNTKPDKILEFVDAWIEQMDRTYLRLREQSALSKLVEKTSSDIYNEYGNTGILNINGEKLTVKVFSCEEYNYNWVEDGYDPSENRILHLKSGRFQDYEEFRVK